MWQHSRMAKVSPATSSGKRCFKSCWPIAFSSRSITSRKSAGDPNGGPGLFFRGRLRFIGRPLQSKIVLSGECCLIHYRPIQHGGLHHTGEVRLGCVPAGQPDAPPDLFTAIQQQLGLKLEPTKAPVEVLVIDSVEKPSEN